MTNKELKNKLTDTIGLLNIPGIGRGRYYRLLKIFGNPANVLSASVQELENVPGISHNIALDVKNKYNPEKASETAARIIQLGWTVYFHDEVDYPAKLKQIPSADIPPLLFSSGIKNDNNNAIAVVGTRHPSVSGRNFAYNLATDLAKSSITVVSGMAEGIDSAAHKGALDVGGTTIAVWGNSLDTVYPPSNRELAEKIKKHGIVYSEYLPDTGPDRSNFPERNRIISGLSDAVVVIEAGKKSGALITASQANLQGRELFAVPGFPGVKMSEGTNELIKNGARLVTSIEDIFEELPRLKGKILSKKFNPLPDMTEVEKKIITSFSDKPVQIDHLSREVNMNIPELMEFLLALELKGIVKELSGKRYVLSEDYI